eukprot:GHUV01003512.1.p1 GENE.GHUV01003512.1~~GHUV01003512.1.p1  ORF type:complete len:106 (+),score=21.47 GHUV01003512.1:285-602(+)
MTETDAGTVLEGDEEVQYVYVTLPKDVDAAQFGPGAIVRFEGLGTNQPQLRSQSGKAVMLGMYQDTLGSVLLVKEEAGAAFNSPNMYTTIGHTDKELKWAKHEQN